jgi:acetyltransferase-like isoleucine patch superfamily enzyme|tara:strand:+ start:669 stop:1484 length:816 start_codon:yes stop_codon:yes gene_type:complete
MIKAEHKDIHESVIIGENVSIECEKVTIGKYSRIGNNVKIKCKELIIGNHLYTADNVEIGRGGCTGPNSVVKIGNGVGIFENVVINPSESVEIGDNCGIGAEVMIWTHGAWLDITKGFPSEFGPVKIGDNVWLPARSIVLPNVVVGDNVVIGTNSLVNKSLPDGCLAAGIPCKVIREDMYPKELGEEELKNMVEAILSDWNVLCEHKGITRTIETIYENGIIILNQGYEQTIYNVVDKEVDGAVNIVSEDLRDYLRRRGIKIYADRFFKSI